MIKNNDELITFLQSNMDGLVTNIVNQRERRVFAETSKENLLKTVEKLKESGINYLGTITGLDNGGRFEVIYHLYNENGLMLNLKTFTPRENPKMPSITGIFAGAFLYERELMDLLGIEVEGNPFKRKYPVPEDWPAGQYPLRKDWKGLPSREEVNQ
ncbi:MAG: NADH-quinone oxidoreductase subunit C [Bacillota bacterium]